MTETPPKSAARLLVEARAAARFSGEWPAELLPNQLAGLMAGCQRKENRAAYDVNARLIADGIKSGTLAIRIEERPELSITKTVNPGQDTFRFATQFEKYGVSVREVYTQKEKQTPLQWINRAACDAWLHAINEQPGELVLAWLGDDWNDAPATGKVHEKKERIKEILSQLEKLDANFKREAMPGRKADFFELCKTVDHKLFAYIAQETFNDYLPGICSFKRGSRATDYYKLKASEIGGNSTTQARI